jgi:hypothetical protein
MKRPISFQEGTVLATKAQRTKKVTRTMKDCNPQIFLQNVLKRKGTKTSSGLSAFVTMYFLVS